MKKNKKITIKFFLNKSVKPVKEGNTLTYPLYMLLTYNRRSTMLRCHYGKYYKDMKSIEKIHYPGFQKFEERIIIKTIQYQLAKQGEKFNIKGIGIPYEKYCIGIDHLFDKYMKSILRDCLMRLEPFEYFNALDWNKDNVTFDTLFEMASKLYGDFEKLAAKMIGYDMEAYLVFMKLYQSSFYQYTFPTVIEWLDKSAIEDYKTKLQLIYKKNEKLINENILLIQRIVDSALN
ncbi:MAG: hypothetical protein NVV82_19215 [Sporocytophaga sp.]|nr:hypothetical protein [Sporocytophaga sp.]